MISMQNSITLILTNLKQNLNYKLKMKRMILNVAVVAVMRKLKKKRYNSIKPHNIQRVLYQCVRKQ